MLRPRVSTWHGHALHCNGAARCWTQAVLGCACARWMMAAVHVGTQGHGGVRTDVHALATAALHVSNPSPWGKGKCAQATAASRASAHIGGLQQNPQASLPLVGWPHFAQPLSCIWQCCTALVVRLAMLHGPGRVPGNAARHWSR